MTDNTAASPPARVGITRFVQRGTARIAYEPVGDVRDGAATIVLLHDLLADRSAFAGWREALLSDAEIGPARLLLPDTRGHGASAAPGARRLTMTDLATDLLAVLDAEEAARAHLVGHGLGGAIALSLAGLAPDRVQSLTMIEPSVPGVLATDPDPEARSLGTAARDHWQTVSDAATRGQTDRALDLLLAPRWGEDWRERLPRPRQAAIRRHVAALGPLLAALTAADPSLEDLCAVTLPVLVVRRARPVHLDGRIVDALVAGLPNARLKSIPGGGLGANASETEANSEIVRLTVEFLAAT